MADLAQLLTRLAFPGTTHLKEVAPGTHAYGSRQATSRVRAYQSANLQPHAARPPLQEMLLVGHVHVKDGKVQRIEGFNGGEGQRWAERAKAEVEKSGLLAPDAVVQTEMPLRNCPASRIQFR